MNANEKLERYSDLQERLDFLEKSVLELHKRAIPKEVTDKIAEIDAEYAPMISLAGDEADALLEEIKAEALTAGVTIKGTRLMIVWAKGRSSWDGKLLDGYAMDHPEILQARKVGEPIVSMRSVK